MEQNIIKLIENIIAEFEKINNRRPTKLYLPRRYEKDIFSSWCENPPVPGLSAVHGFREEIQRNHKNKFKNLEIIWDADELKVE